MNKVIYLADNFILSLCEDLLNADICFLINTLHFLRDRAMHDKIIYVPNNDKQKYPLYRLEL